MGHASSAGAVEQTCHRPLERGVETAVSPHPPDEGPSGGVPMRIGMEVRKDLSSRGRFNDALATYLIRSTARHAPIPFNGLHDYTTGQRLDEGLRETLP